MTAGPKTRRTGDGRRGLIPRPNRSPWLCLGLITVAVVLGIGSRRFGQFLPAFVAAYAGDTLWALAAFAGIALVLPRASTWRVAALAFLRRYIGRGQPALSRSLDRLDP